MSDAWRVTVTFRDPKTIERAAWTLPGHEIEDQVRQRLDAQVAVSVIDLHLYLRTGTRDSAMAAEEVVRDVMAGHHRSGTIVSQFWDPSICRWVNAADSVPDNTGLTVLVHKHRHGPASEIAADTRRANETGTATWQVRVNLPSHREAVAFARRLKAQGHPPVRGWRRLLVGARNQDEACALAAAMHAQAPPWTVMSVRRIPPWILSAAQGSTAG